MDKQLYPTEAEVGKWLLSTLKHSCRVEYFLDKLCVISEDSERPHDLVGPGNKYEWDIIRGFSIQNREPKPDFNAYIMPSLNLHRQQYHHRKCNEPDPGDITKPRKDASESDLMLASIDAVCSLLENREYQGGAHNYEEISEIIKKSPNHKTPYMLKVIPQMQLVEQPNVESIISLINFPNIGLKKDVYESICYLTKKAIENLRSNNGYALL